MSRWVWRRFLFQKKLLPAFTLKLEKILTEFLIGAESRPKSQENLLDVELESQNGRLHNKEINLYHPMKHKYNLQD